VVVLAGVAAGVLSGVSSGRRTERRDREVVAVRSFSSRVRAHLPRDIQTVPPDLIVLFPGLSADLNDLAAGDLRPREALSGARDLKRAARQAADGVAGISVVRVVPAQFPELRARFQESRFLLTESFRLYEAIGGLYEEAARAPDEERRALAEHLQQLVARANTLFDEGWRKVLNEFNRLGLKFPILPTRPIQPPQAPPGATESPGQPAGTPGAEGTGTPEPTSTEAASPEPTPTG
jgi:hypothetical protein